MNLSNVLTLLRIVLTVFFVVVMSAQSHFAHSMALVIFALASLTDWIDGYIARRYESCTSFGHFMDPLADKILVAAALILLIPVGALPPWVVILIITREFIITGLRLLALDQGVVIATDRLGKQKTFAQLLTILFYLFLLSAENFLHAPWISWSWRKLGPFLIGVTLFFTIYSGLLYVWNHRKLFYQ